jgi:hypothetical protein
MVGLKSTYQSPHKPLGRKPRRSRSWKTPTARHCPGLIVNAHQCPPRHCRSRPYVGLCRDIATQSNRRALFRAIAQQNSVTINAASFTHIESMNQLYSILLIDSLLGENDLFALKKTPARTRHVALLPTHSACPSCPSNRHTLDKHMERHVDGRSACTLRSSQPSLRHVQQDAVN